MEIIWTRTKTIVSIVLFALLVAGLVVKWLLFPSVDEKFFQLDYQRLQTAPSGIFIVRATHFGDTRRSGCFSAWMQEDGGQGRPRFVGRNATLEQIIPAAYQTAPSRVVFPKNLATNHYDLLVTVGGNPAEKLQAALKRKLGCAARWQERETEVFVMKVVRPNSPALRPSQSENSDTKFRTGRMHFTRAQVGQLVWMLESLLKKPLRDKTGLTGFYDYSFPWDWRDTQKPDLATVKGWLGELGLTLRSELETVSMLVVEQE